MFFRAPTAAALLLLSLLCTAPAARGQPSDTVLQDLHARIPLGVEGFFVRPARRNLYLLGTAQNPHFEGWKLIDQNGRRIVLGPDGSRISLWPASVQFRVTASLLDDDLRAVDRDFLDLDGNTDLNRYLLNLGFRLKIFHELQVTSIQPDNVEMVGVPADVAYDERIYRASFTLPYPVAVEDRLVLEVIDPRGERLCKFHLEF